MKAVQLSDKSVWYGNKADDTKDIEVSLAGLTGTATHVGLMSGGPCEATVYRVAFVPKAGGGNQSGTLPALPENAEAYTYTQGSLSEASDGSWGYGGASAITEGVLNADFSGQYAEAKYMFSKTYTIGDIKNLILTLSDVTGDIVIKLYDTTENQIGVWYGVTATDVEDKYCGIEYIGAGDGTPIYESLSADTPVGGFGVMALNGACKATVYRVAVEIK